ncbi:NAD-dependent malic enzyme [Streptantibioticus ferralitis]|uniref:NAD-dependent malic enzyme n=1 Tax=Streptantibioticus ferralitis TaxID=236510 RepID=A0ABT5Z4W7_9ACTN|nr:NAD-dependent malic enzyme [Streptantibioticus ferralitis]MDF2258862.1 NAD-dependent malic enzyme [Streptantibioticus ferralitis]
MNTQPVSWNRDLERWETTARGRAVLANSRLNKGTAFTEEERQSLGLIGLIPPRVLTLEQQMSRAYSQFLAQPSDLAKNVNLTSLHDRNEVLFYRLMCEHLDETLPIVYTPTVGTAIQRYSYEYRRPRGIYLSVDAPKEVESSLLASGLGPDDVDLIVATDGEAILGIGDWGVGGINISVGKLAVYTAAGGIDPSRTIPVVLDVGTNRQELLDDPHYLGNRHPRVDQDTYDAFIETYVETATRLYPNAVLHWEDFGPDNARRILGRYRNRCLTFNDDVQGTGAVNLAAVLSGVQASGTPLHEHRVVIFGAGTAGIGVADQLRDAMKSAGLTPDEATRRLWCVARHGLLTQDMAMRDFQDPYARAADEVAGWSRDTDLGGISLAELVHQVKPTVLIGTSGQGGAFTEPLIREMAASVDRPIILPMSNPTPLAEATPAQLLEWTDGRALVATGSPFAPVTHRSTVYQIGQANNAFVFPGLSLGAIVAQATGITDGMLTAAAHAVAEQVDSTAPGAPLLPPTRQLRQTSAAVATAVARAAARDGVARTTIGDDINTRVRAAMWQPNYRPVVAI